MREDVPSVAPAEGIRMSFGSDVVAEMLRRLDLPYISLTPGSSFRGLHDSLVNYLGNRAPSMLLCLHEEHAVAIAHGYAKVTRRPMAVALHSNVGLMHASMALFNAWCDRVPMLVVGGTGPLDAAARRPWIDWIHTATDQAQLVRQFIKWDDQPSSAQAAAEALVHAYTATCRYPSAPVYVCLDAGWQERELSGEVVLPAVGRYAAEDSDHLDPGVLTRVAGILAGAARPLLLVGRVGNDAESWKQRVSLAEAVGAAVITDLKVAAGFPTDHRLHPVPAGVFLPAAAESLLRHADAVLSLDWVDLGGTLYSVTGGRPPTATVISCTLDHVLHNGWSKDHFRPVPADLRVPGHPDALVAALLPLLGGRPGSRKGWPAPAPEPTAAARVPLRQQVGKELAREELARDEPASGISVAQLASALREALGEMPHTLARVPLSWDASAWPFRDPLDYTGLDGGAGIGAGPGLVVGVALGLRGTGRSAVGVMGDGDFLMGATALWTAAHHRLPLLVVVANNRSFFNDEVHQQRVALVRGRPTENRWVGQALQDPDADLAALATSLGLEGLGPVSAAEGLPAVLATAVGKLATGACVVVDVRVNDVGYPGFRR